jgi:hypothetical protein
MQVLAPQDMERRRILVRQQLYAEPNSTRLLALLRSLLTPECLYLAASEGVLVLSHATMALQARWLVEHLHEKGFEAALKIVGAQHNLDETIAKVGVVILILGSQEELDRTMQHSYAVAMTLGKAVIAAVRHPYDLPNLLFDVPPLVWGQDYDYLLEMIDELFTSKIPEDCPCYGEA